MSQEHARPTRTIAFYSRVSVWMALLFLAAGLAFQSLQINMFTQTDVDKAFGLAMAEQMAHTLSLRLKETHRIQHNASVHVKTLNSLFNQDPEWIDTLQQFIPGALNVSLIRREDVMGIPESLGYAVQDIVSRTLNGVDMKLEALQRNGKLQFFRASPIYAGEQIVGVLLVEYGNDWLAQFQSIVSQHPGQVRVIQYMTADKTRGLDIINTGHQAERSREAITVAINDVWFLTYIPADERPQLSIIPLIAPWMAVVSAIIIFMLLFLLLQKFDIKRNKLKLLTYVRSLSRKDTDERPQFTLDLFDELADDMLHIIRKNRSVSAGDDGSGSNYRREKPDISFEPVRRAVITSNVRAVQDEPMAFEVEEMEEDVPCAINPAIFRAYDIRGVVGKDLTDDVCYWIGRAIGSEVLAQNFKSINLAWDGRHSSPNFATALERGVLESGCNVVSLGAAPTGLLYFATHELESPCGVVITGSHNPAEFNGIKIVINQQPLAQTELDGLLRRINERNLTRGQGQRDVRNLNSAYIERLSEDIHIQRPLKVVVDAGNGIAGPLAIKLMEALGLQATFLFCDVDGDFPNHHPDPGVIKNVRTLRETVVKERADLGLAFDGDGDRVALVDNRGKIIWPDRLLMLLAQNILSKQPGSTVLFDVKCSRHLSRLITQLGGKPAMGQTGHSLMKRQLQKLKAAVGGEFSGHIYIQDRWYGFDDGLYAAARLVEILSQHSQSVAEVFAAFPEDVSTPEITIDTNDQRKFAIVQALTKDADLQAGAQVSNVDGLRIEFADGWGLIRPSNTTPKLTLRFAGDDASSVARIQALIKEALKKHAPELQIPF